MDHLNCDHFLVPWTSQVCHVVVQSFVVEAVSQCSRPGEEDGSGMTLGSQETKRSGNQEDS